MSSPSKISAELIAERYDIDEPPDFSEAFDRKEPFVLADLK